MQRTATKSATSIAHSWSIETWPAEVYPHTPERGRWLVRAHRSELMQAGALVRVGREIVLIGAQYDRWLKKQASRVPGYEIAPNAREERQSA